MAEYKKYESEELHAGIKTIDPRRGFRWLFKVSGIEPYMIRSLKSLADGDVELGIHWSTDQAAPSEPYSNVGVLEFLDVDGKVTDTWELTWNHHQVLLFDLDYSQQITQPKIILKNVKVRRI